MESEEAIMENENNCNLESESINKEREEEALQDANLRMSPSIPEGHDLNYQPDSSVNIEELGHKTKITSIALPDLNVFSTEENVDSLDLSSQNKNIVGCDASGSNDLLMEPDQASCGNDAFYNCNRVQANSTGVYTNRTDVLEQVTQVDCEKSFQVFDKSGDSSKIVAKVGDNDYTALRSSLADSTESLVLTTVENPNPLYSADYTQRGIQQGKISEDNLEYKTPKVNAASFSYSRAERAVSDSSQQGGHEQLKKKKIQMNLIEFSNQAELSEVSVNKIKSPIAGDFLSRDYNEQDMTKTAGDHEEPALMKIDQSNLLTETFLRKTDQSNPPIEAPLTDTLLSLDKANREEHLSSQPHAAQMNSEKYIIDIEKAPMSSKVNDVKLPMISQDTDVKSHNVQSDFNQGDGVIEAPSSYEESEDKGSPATDKFKGQVENHRDKNSYNDFDVEQIMEDKDKDIDFSALMSGCAKDQELQKEQELEHEKGKKMSVFKVVSEDQINTSVSSEEKDLLQSKISDSLKYSDPVNETRSSSVLESVDKTVYANDILIPNDRVLFYPAKTKNAEKEAIAGHEWYTVSADQFKEINSQNVESIENEMDTDTGDVTLAEKVLDSKRTDNCITYDCVDKLSVERTDLDESAAHRTNYTTDTNNEIATSTDEINDWKTDSILVVSKNETSVEKRNLASKACEQTDVDKMLEERESETANSDEIVVEKTNLCSEMYDRADADKMQEVSHSGTTLITVGETPIKMTNPVTAVNVLQAKTDAVDTKTSQVKTVSNCLSSKASTDGNNETRNLIDSENIKQELMSDDGFSTKEQTTDAKVLQMIKKEVVDTNKAVDTVTEHEDVVVLDDDGESFPLKKEPVMLADSNLVISSISSQEHRFHEEVTNSEVDPNKTAVISGKGCATKKNKTKTQTCIVCLKVCRCKYNIVRNGDIKHLCGDDCFKRFRKTPSTFLKNKDGKPTESPKSDTSTMNRSLGIQDNFSKFKTCSVCQLMNVNPDQPFCNWKGLDFCGESCLGKFQANLSTTCSFCHAFITPDMRATFCLKIGNDMRPFCKQRCIKEFNKNLRLCACCQKDLSSIPGAFSAMVGSLDKKIRQFCSQTCRQRLETRLVGVEVVSQFREKTSNNSSTLHTAGSLSPGNELAACSVCQKMQTVKHTVRFQGKVQRLCSNLCLSAFKYTNKISMSKCDSCGTVCTFEEAQAHFVQYEGQVKRFCSDMCVNMFRRDNNKVMSCCWCGTKKMNFDMIERLDADNKFQMFCSLNCLSLYRVNLQAKSNQAVPCDQCKKVTPAQYHLTMSDASVRNFCSYTCVMTFQSQFTSKHLPPVQSMMTEPLSAPQKQIAMPIQPKEQDQPVLKGRGRMSTRNATRQNSPSFPVISNVVSLAPSPGQQSEQPPSASTDTSFEQANKNFGPNTMSTGDGKHQILIQAPPVKIMKNKSLQCRPVTLTKATSCRPHSQTKEIQTEKIPDKQVIVPIPVPVYVPMPMAMYSAPTPIPVPFPIPIPVPVFIPTTRKSTAGILKTITDIVERMPSDPLEAELLMMAEAVASHKKDSDSESDPEADFGTGFDDELEEPIQSNQSANGPPQMKKKEGQGEEDMIQMALRMAEEMSTPIEDLESSVEPVAVNTDPPNSIHTTPLPSYQADEDYVPPGSRGRGRGLKRSRTRTTNSRPKRQRMERNYTEDENLQTQTTKQPAIPQHITEPPADASYRLKFTYGVNAWRHWVIAKNSHIEKMKTNISSRVRTFPTDILKCTTDELNFSLIFFIKEVRKPNGEEYSPDSIYYLCLGIQQYLYENGRIDSIFTDSYFEKFADSLHKILQNLQPKVNAQGQMLCRIEEEHLWESKQLGAHSPFVLLNTLIYFHTKHFILKTAQEHMSLSFAQILKHWKKGMPLKGQTSSGKNISLRFYCLANGKKDNLAARKSKEGMPVYEITENFDNPLRCPVKLYEFFLSKCPESIKNRNDIFYPVPERSCVPDSPVWYSTQSIGLHTMDRMLTRVLLVREIQESHLHAQPIYL